MIKLILVFETYKYWLHNSKAWWGFHGTGGKFIISIEYTVLLWMVHHVLCSLDVMLSHSALFYWYFNFIGVFQALVEIMANAAKFWNIFFWLTCSSACCLFCSMAGHIYGYWHLTLSFFSYDYVAVPIWNWKI